MFTAGSFRLGSISDTIKSITGDYSSNKTHDYFRLKDTVVNPDDFIIYASKKITEYITKTNYTNKDVINQIGNHLVLIKECLIDRGYGIASLFNVIPNSKSLVQKVASHLRDFNLEAYYAFEELMAKFKIAIQSKLRTMREKAQIEELSAYNRLLRYFTGNERLICNI